MSLMLYVFVSGFTEITVLAKILELADRAAAGWPTACRRLNATRAG